jgi:hypothetical protein
MSIRDYFDAFRGKGAPAGGSGKATTRTGEVLDLELFKFDT